MKLFNKFKAMSGKAKLLTAGLLLAVAVGAPVAVKQVQAGFFPGRPTYDYNKSDPNPNCNDPNSIGRQNGRCGSMNGPVFNSFVNTPDYGDERYFTDGYRTDQGDPSTADTIRDVTEGSKEVTIRVYVHNNANQSTNASGVGVAHDTKVFVDLPKNSGTALQAVGNVSASNATPNRVSDTVYMTAGRAFHVEYVPGSAVLLRNQSSTPLSDSIVTTGAHIGDQQMNGELPGCFEFSALVEVKVKIVPEEDTDLQVVKEVKNVGDTNWHKEVASKPGQEQQWLVTTKNIGLDPLTNVTVRDVLPPHLQFVPGSVKMVNADQSSFPQKDAPLFGNGLDLGTYPSDTGRYILFKTKALDDFAGCSIRVRNIALARSTQTSETRDTADVVITKDNCKPNPSYKCDMLTASVGANRKVTFTAKASAANGASIKLYRFNFGDNTPELVTDKNVVEHTYPNDGQFAARVSVDFDVNGTVKNANGPQCAVSVTLNTPQNPTGKGPTELVNTGPGEVAALFAVITATGALGHRWLTSRRLG